MRAALPWLEDDHVTENWWMIAAREALFGRGDSVYTYASQCCF